MRALIALLSLSAGLCMGQRPPVEQAWDLLANKQRPEAIRLLQSVIRSDPGNADARLLLGSVLQEDGDRAGALAQLSEAARLRPQSAEAQNALGEAYNAFGDEQAARPYFEKALALDAKFAPAHVNLAALLLQEAAFAAAAEHLDRAVALMGEKTDAAYAHYLRAKIYVEQEDVPKAEAQLREAVRLQPDFAEAWSDLGDVRKTLMDDRGALEALQRAVALAPDDAVAQTRLGAEYLELHKAHEAVPYLREAARLDPQNQSTLYSLQRALREDGQAAEAEEVKKRLAVLLREKDTSDQNLLAGIELNKQGVEREKSGDLAGAAAKYRAALALLPEHNGIRVNLAVALLRTGHWQEGLELLREAARREPANPQLQAALDDALAQAPAEFGGKPRK